MFDPDVLPEIRRRIREHTATDGRLLEEVLGDVQEMRPMVRAIQPRGTTSISLVASDGGNNTVEFNPFYLQLVRVVDSYGHQLFLDVVSPSTSIVDLGQRHLDSSSPLGLLMRDLGVSRLGDLSPMLPDVPRSPSWTLVYRDICEWAILYDLICRTTFTTDTLIVRDGLLRSKIFQGGLFIQLYRRMMESIDRIKKDRHREVYLVGVAKRSEVLQRYSMAMSIADIMPGGSAYFVPVPMAMQRKVYRWQEYIVSPDDYRVDAEDPKFNIGAMYFVRFGVRTGDPVWTVDVLAAQKERDQKIFGCLLGDAITGFPIPYYPSCLQQADHHAQVVDFDLDILQDTLVDAIRKQIPSARRAAFDAHRLIGDVAHRRYG